jgi:N,N'-diacetyllegionaminate synthase
MSKVIIIAEAGVNHNGSLEIAKKLIDVASEAGADYVKFQTFKYEYVVSKFAKKETYQIENTRNTIDNQLEMDSQTVMDLLESNSGIEKAMYFINDKGEFYNPSGIDEEFQFAIKQEIRRSKIKVGSVLIIKTNSKE